MLMLFIDNVVWGYNRPPDINCFTDNYFFYFSTKTYVVGTQKNRYFTLKIFA